MIEHLSRNARALNLPYRKERRLTYNSRLAQELGLWAQETGSGERFHTAAFKAYFVDDRNLAYREVLLDIAESAGLERNQAAAVIDTRSHAAAVDRDWQRAGELGITAVPSFVVGEAVLVGAREYRSLASFVQAQGVRRR